LTGLTGSTGLKEKGWNFGRANREKTEKEKGKDFDRINRIYRIKRKRQ